MLRLSTYIRKGEEFIAKQLARTGVAKNIIPVYHRRAASEILQLKEGLYDDCPSMYDVIEDDVWKNMEDREIIARVRQHYMDTHVFWRSIDSTNARVAVFAIPTVSCLRLISDSPGTHIAEAYKYKGTM